MKKMGRPIVRTDGDAQRIFEDEHRKVCVRTDRLIAVIMVIQWPAAIVASLLLSPRTWEGGTSSIHPHLLAAIQIGGLITVFPVLLAILQPGQKLTRHVIAVCQMLMSALLIHISGGRIETHFHVFGSLALLALYLDWEVLISGTVATLLDHFIMGHYAPVAIFGTAISSNSRLIEHVLWVVYFDAFLITSCVQSLKGLRAVARREADQEILLYQAYHDALTGLGNRLLIQKEIVETTSDPARKDQTFALMALDLDRFKEVNDTLGHQTGDMVLTEVSLRLREQIRKHDTLVRMGGDEFALIVSDCSDIHVVENIAERIIESLSRPIQCGEQSIRIGVSIGICFDTEAKSESSSLFHQADLALYKAKNNGRNRYHIFDKDMRAETQHQMSLEHRLRQAVTEETLHLHYQPIVNTEGRLLGFEALLRWHDALHGDISPVDFIPLAEKNGLIVPLGAWVIRQACTQAAAWHRAGNKVVKMSVNVSYVQLADVEFVQTVLRALKETGLPPELLDLELTESTLIQNHSETRKALELLREFGVRLSIDDFGTGYSSLSYLKHLPVHTLKIDRSFVKDIADSNEARALIEGMIDMAHSLHLRVVAEGVENRAQLDLLSLAGCDEIQGFFISKPVSSDEANRFLNKDGNEEKSDVLKRRTSGIGDRRLAEVA